jgi:hypothetical protein
MRRVLVLVEGQTEERFVKDVLCPHLWIREVDLIPTISTTKRVKSGPDFKGGITDYQKVEKDVLRLLNDTDAVAVTTFIDYYGLPSDFPGMPSRPPGNPIPRAVHVETSWQTQIGDPRFRPFLMVHEFEALLFANPGELGAALYLPPGSSQLLHDIRASFSSPEEINDNPGTAPSRRIIGVSPAYRKTLHGPLVAGRIGLPVICQECSHFAGWLDWLETL